MGRGAERRLDGAVGGGGGWGVGNGKGSWPVCDTKDNVYSTVWVRTM